MDTKTKRSWLLENDIDVKRYWNGEIIDHVYDNAQFYADNPDELTLPKIKKLLNNDDNSNNPNRATDSPEQDNDNRDEGVEEGAEEGAEGGTEGGTEGGAEGGTEGEEEAPNTETRRERKIASIRAMASAARNRPQSEANDESDEESEGDEKPVLDPKKALARPRKVTRKRAPSIVSGHMLLVTIDLVCPAAIVWIHNIFVSDEESKLLLSDVKMSDDQIKAMTPIANSLAEDLALNMSPLVAFALFSFINYASNVVVAKM